MKQRKRRAPAAIPMSHITSAEWRKAERVVLDYGSARQKFRLAQALPMRLLAGNDNKVGIAGEYWLLKYFQHLGYQLVERPGDSNNEGYDFVCRKAGRRYRVSAKCVSSESERGRGMRLKPTKSWDILALVTLDDALSPVRFGWAERSQFNLAKRKRAIGKQPAVSRTWMNQKGWMSTYGTVKKSPF